jgi:hypothetical protein
VEVDEVAETPKGVDLRGVPVKAEAVPEEIWWATKQRLTVLGYNTGLTSLLGTFFAVPARQLIPGSLTSSQEDKEGDFHGEIKAFRRFVC